MLHTHPQTPLCNGRSNESDEGGRCDGGGPLTLGDRQRRNGETEPMRLQPNVPGASSLRTRGRLGGPASPVCCYLQERRVGCRHWPLSSKAQFFRLVLHQPGAEVGRGLLLAVLSAPPASCGGGPTWFTHSGLSLPAQQPSAWPCAQARHSPFPGLVPRGRQHLLCTSSP